MSSVTRFIRQIPTSSTYYSASTVATTPATYCYEFNPSSANVVGNYPPGHMTAASASLQAAVTAAGTPANLVLRDMGKTVQAPIGSLTGPVGFFRQVQLLSASALTAAQGYNGGSAGNTFGVLGAANTPNANTDYLTFYVPSVVMGIAGVAAASVEPRMGGAM